MWDGNSVRHDGESSLPPEKQDNLATGLSDCQHSRTFVKEATVYGQQPKVDNLLDAN